MILVVHAPDLHDRQLPERYDKTVCGGFIIGNPEIFKTVTDLFKNTQKPLNRSKKSNLIRVLFIPSATKRSFFHLDLNLIELDFVRMEGSLAKRIGFQKSPSNCLLVLAPGFLQNLGNDRSRYVAPGFTHGSFFVIKGKKIAAARNSCGVQAVDLKQLIQ